MFQWLDNVTADPAPPAHRSAIVSIVLGDNYARTWNILCKNSWLAYAEKYGLDVIVIAAPLDSSPRAQGRSPSWQKLLVFDLPWAQRYAQLVWIDADVIISKSALNILDSVLDQTKVGISRLSDQLSAADQHVYMERLYSRLIPLEAAAAAWRDLELHIFKAAGIVTTAPMFNGGVFVASPTHHRQMFLQVYAQESWHRAYEQPHLSLALYEAGIAHTI